MPGGCYEDINQDLDADAPNMGPWKRCVRCGTVKDDLRKCGGSCRGAYYFCSNACLIAGCVLYAAVDFGAIANSSAIQMERA